MEEIYIVTRYIIPATGNDTHSQDPKGGWRGEVNPHRRSDTIGGGVL